MHKTTRDRSSCFFDAEKSDGTKIATSNEAAKEFPFRSKVVIQGVEIIPEKMGKNFQVSLNVQNVASKASAGVVLLFEPQEMTPTRIYESINSTFFRTRPVPPVPRLGMSGEVVLHCWSTRPHGHRRDW